MGKGKRNGQLIVEMLIALSIGVTGILGILGLLSRSLSLNRVVADNYQASLLAAEGIEIVKNIIDTDQINGNWNDWLPGTPGNGWYRIDYTTQTLEPGDFISGTPIDCATVDPPLKFDPSTHTYSYTTGETTRFRRCIYIEEIAGEDRFRINTIVAWTVRGGGKFTTNVEDYFYNWRQ